MTLPHQALLKIQPILPILERGPWMRYWRACKPMPIAYLPLRALMQIKPPYRPYSRACSNLWPLEPSQATSSIRALNRFQIGLRWIDANERSQYC